MANQIPLSEAVNAAGGFLVEPQLGNALIQKVSRESAVMSLSRVQRVANSNRMSWPVYLGRPTAGFVGEAAAKPQTGAEFGQLTANIKKIATIVRYTEELLADARIDPQILINPDVEAAFSDLVDLHMLGTHPGGASTQANFTTSFDAALLNTTQTVELGTGQDAFAVALSSAIATIEANGGTPNGMAAALDTKGHLRDARDTQGRPLYGDGFTNPSQPIYGLTPAFTTNLDGFPAGLLGGVGSPGKTVAVVGDFTHSIPVIRNDLTTRVLTEATIGGVNLAETNQTAVLWEMRVGYQVFDLNRMFVRIVNAA